MFTLIQAFAILTLNYCSVPYVGAIPSDHVEAEVGRQLHSGCILSSVFKQETLSIV